VAIGDRIQIQGSTDGRVRVVTLTADHHEPDLGFISASYPEGAAMLAAQEDEEVECEVNGKPTRWMIVKIEKGSGTRP
jgi:transcription elongation GreA/GreB family factor